MRQQTQVATCKIFSKYQKNLSCLEGGSANAGTGTRSVSILGDMAKLTMQVPELPLNSDVTSELILLEWAQIGQKDPFQPGNSKSFVLLT